jgi:hypothetical protein
MSRKPNPEATVRRRRKRIAKQNGDRQYFNAVRKLRRDRIDKWMLEHNPEKFKQRLAQLTLQAKKRQFKQERRELMRTMPVGTTVGALGSDNKRIKGEVIEHTTDRDFPVMVQFRSGIIEDFAPEVLKVY